MRLNLVYEAISTNMHTNVWISIKASIILHRY